jgi:hypothetical protein
MAWFNLPKSGQLPVGLGDRRRPLLCTKYSVVAVSSQVELERPTVYWYAQGTWTSDIPHPIPQSQVLGARSLEPVENKVVPPPTPRFPLRVPCPMMNINMRYGEG